MPDTQREACGCLACRPRPTQWTKPPREIAREILPGLTDGALDSVIRAETGWPAFWPDNDAEACFRRQLTEARERLRAPGYAIGDHAEALMAEAEAAVTVG